MHILILNHIMDSILDYMDVPGWLATGLELIIEHCFSNQIWYDQHYKTRVSALEYRDNLINWNYTPSLLQFGPLEILLSCSLQILEIS